jgi:hypothetical protein
MGTNAMFAEFMSHMHFGGVPGQGGWPGDWSDGGSDRRSADAVKKLPVTLEELYVGKHFKMMSKRKVTCHTCRGSVPPIPVVMRIQLTGVGAEPNPGPNPKSVLLAVAQEKKSWPLCSVTTLA